MKKVIKFKILGKNWKLGLLNTVEYRAKHGRHMGVAVTDVNTREIDLSPKGRDLETIYHELIHGYLGEMCVHSCDLDDDNLEEIFCELFSKRAKEILELGIELKEKL